MATKKTIATKFDEVIAILENLGHEEQAKFIAERKELHEKKNATRKLTKTQAENEEIKEKILATMEKGKSYTITDIMKAIGLESNQKTSALVRQLRDTDLVVRTEIKGRAYFSLA